jgi:hypothetical protein
VPCCLVLDFVYLVPEIASLVVSSLLANHAVHSCATQRFMLLASSSLDFFLVLVKEAVLL